MQSDSLFYVVLLLINKYHFLVGRESEIIILNTRIGPIYPFSADNYHRLHTQIDFQTVYSIKLIYKSV